MSQTVLSPGTEYKLLSLASRINPDEGELQKLSLAAAEVIDWDRLVESAENNSIAPLLYTNLRACGAELPDYTRRQLYALVQRHKWANETRAEVLGEIIDACTEKGIQLLVLKGSFLAHRIYPDPSLRSMSDIDLLASPSEAPVVQETLREMGFSMPEQQLSRYMANHHHLPGASMIRNGLNVAVEVHHDALSGDAPASITTNNLTAPIQSFSVAGHDALALGHQDQLRHLFHHMSEPAMRLKLIWVTDIVYYACHFHDEIDWPAMQKEYPQVVNALSLMGYIMTLPDALQRHVPKLKASPPAGIGTSILPLSVILGKPVKLRASLLLRPSDWWMRLYYGVAPTHSLLTTRLFRHPAKVLAWLTRRIRASRYA